MNRVLTAWVRGSYPQLGAPLSVYHHYRDQALPLMKAFESWLWPDSPTTSSTKNWKTIDYFLPWPTITVARGIGSSILRQERTTVQNASPDYSSGIRNK